MRNFREFHISIRRLIWKALGTTKVMPIHVDSDAALLPQDFEFLGAVSQRHPEA
jgi:hypothetical protein